MTRRRRTHVVLLPWENRRALLSNLLSQRRIRPALGALLLLLTLAFAYQVSARHTRVRTTRAAIAELQRATFAFRAAHGRCPRSASELVHPPHDAIPDLHDVPQDGWGRDLLLRCPSDLDPQSADVVSAGESGSFSIDDNID